MFGTTTSSASFYSMLSRMGPLSCTSREVSSKQKLRNRDSTPQLARVLYQQSYWVYLDLLFGCHSPYLGTPNIWNFEISWYCYDAGVSAVLAGRITRVPIVPWLFPNVLVYTMLLSR